MSDDPKVAETGSQPSPADLKREAEAMVEAKAKAERKLAKKIEAKRQAKADAAALKIAKQVDPVNRPNFSAPPVEAKDEKPTKTKKGFLPGSAMIKKGVLPVALREMYEERPQDRQAFHQNKLPLNFDAAELSVARVALAQNATQSGGMSHDTAWNTFAPREKAYYQYLDSVAKESKAAGEFVSGQDGAFLAPEVWSTQFYDMLYPRQILSSVPITRMPVSSRIQHIPRLTSQVTISYAAESGTLTASNPQFSQNTLNMRKQYAFVQIPNELIRDSAPAADQLIQAHATTRMAVDRDTQILRGNGQAGAPTGLLNITNVGSASLGTNGATPAYTDLTTGVYNVRNLNASANVLVGQTDCTGIIAAVRLELTVANMKDSSGRPLWQFGLNQIGRVPAPGLFGVPNWVLSNIIPTNLTVGTNTDNSEIYYGDWQYLIYGMRQDVEFLATNVGGTSFAQDQTWIRLISRYDVTCMHPEAFFVHTGVRG